MTGSRGTTPWDHAEEDGFTLAELLISIALMGFVGTAVVMSLYMGLRNTDETTQRVAESIDAQFTASYFGADVQNAESVLGSSAASEYANECGSVAGTIHGVFSWTNIEDSFKVADDSTRWMETAVWYVPSETTALRRVHCRYEAAWNASANTFERPGAGLIVDLTDDPIAGNIDASLVNISCDSDTCAISATGSSGFTYALSASRRSRQ